MSGGSSNNANGVNNGNDFSLKNLKLLKQKQLSKITKENTQRERNDKLTKIISGKLKEHSSNNILQNRVSLGNEEGVNNSIQYMH